MSSQRRILIRGTNWIGDSVMSLPALRELRRLYPKDQLTLIVRPWVADLFRGQELVDQIVTLEKNEPGWRDLFKMAGRVRNFDVALLFQNAFGAALMAFLARAGERIGYSTDGRGFLLTRTATPRIHELHRHQIYYYLDLLYQTGLSSRDYLHDPCFSPDIRLQPVESGIHHAQRLLARAGIQSHGRPIVLLNPGAYYGSAKRWFVDRYASLADRLIDSGGVQVALVGSGGELRLAHEIQKLMRHSPAIFTGQTDLPALMGLLHQASLFITNDSGPMHLASALGIPQIALFGSTDEIATGPFSSTARVIHKHVECSPCLLRECPIDLRCFGRIEVNEVYEAALDILSETGNFSRS